MANVRPFRHRRRHKTHALIHHGHSSKRHRKTLLEFHNAKQYVSTMSPYIRPPSPRPRHLSKGEVDTLSGALHRQAAGGGGGATSISSCFDRLSMRVTGGVVRAKHHGA